MVTLLVIIVALVIGYYLGLKRGSGSQYIRERRMRQRRNRPDRDERRRDRARDRARISQESHTENEE